MRLPPALSRVLLTGAIMLGALPVTGVVQAAQADVDFLNAYVGQWRGVGTATYADNGNSESVLCRLTLEAAPNNKVRVTGGCSLAGGSIPINGTVAYVDVNRRYEAILTTASYSGTAVGRRRGQNLQFEMTRSDNGSIYEIDLAMAMRDDAIDVDFEVVDTTNDWGVDATVPFERQ